MIDQDNISILEKKHKDQGLILEILSINILFISSYNNLIGINKPLLFISFYAGVIIYFLLLYLLSYIKLRNYYESCEE